MNVARRFIKVIVYAGMLVGLLVAAWAGEDKSDRPDAWVDGFETAEPTWQREYTDATVNLQVHDRSQRAAHGGRLSEHFSLNPRPEHSSSSVMPHRKFPSPTISA